MIGERKRGVQQLLELFQGKRVAIMTAEAMLECELEVDKPVILLTDLVNQTQKV